MSFVFSIVALTLDWIAAVTGFTYNEINIIAYYILLPFVYVALIDRILRTHVGKIVYVLGWVTALVLIRDFRTFSDALFQGSVDFLLAFSGAGLDYVAASVLICVILPGIVFTGLLLIAFPRLRARLSGRQKSDAGRALERR